MANTWVVVADGGSARIFTTDSPIGALLEREDFAHPEARVRQSSLVSDRQGRTTDSSGRRHAYAGEESPRESEARAFAKLLADRLRQARVSGELDQLVLVAAPEFLGRLRAALDAETRKHVDSELSLDLTALTPKEIRARLLQRSGAKARTH